MGINMNQVQIGTLSHFSTFLQPHWLFVFHPKELEARNEDLSRLDLNI